MPARTLVVTSPSELDVVEGILLAAFHVPKILSMWPVKKEFGSAGHTFVISCLSGIPVSIQLPKPQRQNHNHPADLHMFCLTLWIRGVNTSQTSVGQIFCFWGMIDLQFVYWNCISQYSGKLLIVLSKFCLWDEMQTANYVKVNTYLGTIEKSQCLGEMITLNYDVPLALIWDITPESAHLLLRLIRLVDRKSVV